MTLGNGAALTTSGTGKIGNAAVLDQPAIADFTNATHLHSDTASGGFLTALNGYAHGVSTTADFTTTSTASAVDVTTCGAAAPAGTYVGFYIMGAVNSSTTAGMKFSIHSTSAPSALWAYYIFGVTGFNQASLSGADTLSANLTGSSTSDAILLASGTILTNGATTLTMQVQKTTSGTATVRVGTICRWWRTQP